MAKDKANANGVLSLDMLKPQIVDVQIVADGETMMTIPIMPLTYAEWNNAALGIDIPSPPNKRVLKDGKMEDAPNYDDYDYQRAVSQANATVGLRRIAKALAGGGAFGAELADLSEDEQLARLEDLDAGVFRALLEALQMMALRKRGNIFRPESEQLSETDPANLSQNGQRPDMVAVDPEL